MVASVGALVGKTRDTVAHLGKALGLMPERQPSACLPAAEERRRTMEPDGAVFPSWKGPCERMDDDPQHAVLVWCSERVVSAFCKLHRCLPLLVESQQAAGRHDILQSEQFALAGRVI